MMTIAQELEERMWYLADPKVRWVQGNPVELNESCLLHDGIATYPGFSPEARRWLDEFCYYYVGASASAMTFNDVTAKTRRDVILMLEEAIDQAKWEGV